MHSGPGFYYFDHPFFDKALDFSQGRADITGAKMTEKGNLPALVMRNMRGIDVGSVFQLKIDPEVNDSFMMVHSITEDGTAEVVQSHYLPLQYVNTDHHHVSPQYVTGGRRISDLQGNMTSFFRLSWGTGDLLDGWLPIAGDMINVDTDIDQAYGRLIAFSKSTRSRMMLLVVAQRVGVSIASNVKTDLTLKLPTITPKKRMIQL